MARTRHLGWSLLALAVSACVGTTPVTTPPAAVTSSPAQSATPRPTPDAAGGLDATIDVGDGRLTHVLCRGEAKSDMPTIWLENGLDGSLHNWTSVRGPLQRLSRVCGWDRPGTGDSDAPPGAVRTVDDVVDDLEATIDGAAIGGPLVLVAHSLGPWVSTVFTARRPDDVVGLVLVDPRGPDVTDEHLAALGTPVAGEDPVVTEVRGFMADGGFDENGEHLPFAPSEAIVRGILDAAGPAFGDRPVVVLGAERTIDDFPSLPEPIVAEWWRVWRAGQQAYAAESTAGSFVEVPGSGHLVMDDRPRAVIDAVTDVLDRVGAP